MKVRTSLISLLSPLAMLICASGYSDTHKNKIVNDTPFITKMLHDEEAIGFINDTGINWSGEFPSGNTSAPCSSNIIGFQDCHHGRDVTHADDADGHAGFSYTKLDSAGNPLSKHAPAWTCVKDNVTGLIWEVKTGDGGIHDTDNNYRWGGITSRGSGWGTYYNDWNSLIEGSNSANFCGYSNWRVPSEIELENLMNWGRTDPAIDTNYFPKTRSRPYWSSSPFSSSPYQSNFVDFNATESHYWSGYYSQYRYTYYPVRLVYGDI